MMENDNYDEGISSDEEENIATSLGFDPDEDSDEFEGFPEMEHYFSLLEDQESESDHDVMLKMVMIIALLWIYTTTLSLFPLVLLPLVKVLFPPLVKVPLVVLAVLVYMFVLVLEEEGVDGETLK